jgi:iduronate 2-sulfatase
MHGLANGEIRRNAGEMDVYQSVDGPDSSYPDGWIAAGALQELRRLANKEKSFFLAVGFIRPHLPFGAPAKYMAPYAEAHLPPIPHPSKPQGTSTWHKSSEFKQYNRWDHDPTTDVEFALEVRRHYAACVSYADAQVGLLLEELNALNLDDKTIVVLWGDHGWHLGEHAVWGKHTLFEESLCAPLIIRDLNRIKAGQRSDAIVESIDVFPTLCELADLPLPKSLDGRSLVPQSNNPEPTRHTAVSYHRSVVTLRSDTHRLIVHQDGYVELYNHLSPEKETLNIAGRHPDLVLTLTEQLHKRSPEKLPRSLLQQITLKSHQAAAANATRLLR